MTRSKTGWVAFQQRYNAIARPFAWKFTPADLEDLMARIERHIQEERTDPQPAALLAT
ncbi:hypothetical protein ACQEVF_50905 [Nonomuraea polychroma]|uniref:hypothetical protein n=1 Tax=Nonomuraea polychroma TaxID=46176 RepID=UPI003D912664